MDAKGAFESIDAKGLLIHRFDMYRCTFQRDKFQRDFDSTSVRYLTQVRIREPRIFRSNLLRVEHYGFLNECTIEPLRNKIGQYLTSLENIISTEKGERRDKSQQLYNQYKKISNFFVKILSDILDTRPDRALARKWDSNRSRNQFHIHQPTFTNDGTNNVKQSVSDHNPCSILCEEISVPSSPSKEQEIFHHNYIEDPEYFEKLIDNVDLTYIRGEDDLTPPRPKSEFPVVNSWDSFEIDDIDIIKVFNSLRNSNLPRKNPESAILGILGLTRQHKLTKNKLITIWSDLLNDFQLDVVWNMIELDRSEIEVFDNMKVIRKSTNFLVQHVLFYRIANASYIILSAHLKILKSSLDPYQDKFRKYWSEQQLTASRERRKEANKERARIGQKTDIIIELLTGPALICEVSGGLPAGCPKKIWTDKVDGRHEGYD
ncbi:uncharacterized protein OCT59_001053 [Rhizophagus irregularis]|uniref:uncharacterized protein n=1 Tax=Rhizophagus irregularis TaxID=588596 RepID=UPI003317043B|nr:hypothetical protein OCT59_001053 [Rhizophagus irregularis]